MVWLKAGDVISIPNSAMTSQVESTVMLAELDLKLTSVNNLMKHGGEEAHFRHGWRL